MARSIADRGPIIFSGQLGNKHELKGQGINIWREIHYRHSENFKTPLAKELLHLGDGCMREHYTNMYVFAYIKNFP